MTRGTLLSLVNLSLVAGLVMAASDVVAQQQTTPTSIQIVYTTCGPGVLEMCGQKDLFHCEWRFDIRLTTLPFSGGLAIGSQQCVKSGQIPLYKDRPGTYSQCESTRLPNRPPGDDDGQNYLEEENFSDLCSF